MNTWLPQVFWNLVTQSPFFLAMLVGSILAIARWRRHPGVSAALLLAVAILTISTLGGTFLTVWLPHFMRERGDGSPQHFSVIFGAISLVRSGIGGIAWGLLLFAVFSGRPRNEIQ